MKRNNLLLLTSFYLLLTVQLVARNNALKVGVIGLTHTHVHWIFGSQERGDIEIVGIVETNKELAQRYAEQHGYSMDLVFDSMDELIASKQPEAVTAFGTIYEHLAVVEKCAPLGIHVMVEKPLAVNLQHARKMENLAKKHNIHLLTNYETTWYPTNHKAYDLVKKENTIGDIRKIVVRNGHKGPKKIGINSEFLNWLTDPKQNGGGAVIDFGCYGANLATWLMDGQRPKSVTAITTQLQHENNPNVDDEAIILLEYEKSVVVVHGSWNWPIGRKDMEIYGLSGVVYSDNRHDLRVRTSEGYDGYTEETYAMEERAAPLDDPFSYFAAVIRGEVDVRPTDLSALENNMVVMEIIDAAIRSANTGQKVLME